MRRVIHTAAIAAGRFVFNVCSRTVVLHRERAGVPGPFIIACTHISHVEPAVVSCMLNRRIDWVTRLEYFANPFARAGLRLIDAIPINRQGTPVRAIRTSIARLKEGRVVGIFPEGGVTVGTSAIFRGGPAKQGVCLISRRANVPIVPVVVLGCEKMNRVKPWLPIRSARLWVNIGHPVQPILDHHNRRAARQLLAVNLQNEFVATYKELLATCGLDDSTIP